MYNRTSYVKNIQACVDVLFSDIETVAMFKKYWKSLDRYNAFKDHKTTNMIDAGWSEEKLEGDITGTFKRLCGYLFRKNSEADEKFLGFVDEAHRLDMVIEVERILATETQIRSALERR